MLEVLGVLQPRHEDEVVRLVCGEGGVGRHAHFNWTESTLRPELQHQRGWGLWQDDQLQAFVLWRDLGDEAEITILATHPRAQGRGLMKRLLKQVFDACSYKFWLLEVHEENHAAQQLYAALDFIEVGRRARYYRDGKSALLFNREGRRR